MFLPFILFLIAFPLTMALETFQGAITNNCLTHCGNITVPYPFGIGIECSLDHTFNLTCNNSNNEIPKLFLGEEENNIRIYNISDSEMRIFTQVSYKCYDQRNMSHDEFLSWTTLGTSKVFSFSEKNKFTVVGCDEFALITATEEDDFSSGCFGQCQKTPNVSHGQCSGAGCCQISLPKGLTYYNVVLDSLQNHSDVWSFNKCGYGFLVEEGSFQFSGVDGLSADRLDFVNRIESTMPILLDWVIAPNGGCAAEVVNECKENSSCYNVEGGGYLCKCNEGYEGNPYLHPGCQDINECSDVQGNTYPCSGICVNTVGNYSCMCPLGFVGDAYITNGCIVLPKASTSHLPLIIVLSVSMGVVFLLGIIVLYKVIKKTKERRRRKMYFKRNGGLLLKQQEDADSSLVDRTIIFTSCELEKATDNFNENRILGRGGHGTVYKGMLVNGKIVAVKKSKLVDESQLEQFINEVVILSQVNHRNVVKLLGCCLETDVPMLVSEFIPNGTLYDLLHNETQVFHISLSMRLQIATEVAGALSYLHSATSIPIYHRDIKTSNILLDGKYRAKVSDFGTSRFVYIEQTHLTTLVKGTFGYLDPEYFQTSQFTEKSDVYSFGVVLAELLTREKPISLTRFGENRSLATHFMLALEEGRVMSILDTMVVKEGAKDDLLALANLAMRCLNLNGKYRPTMKEVTTELETLRTSHMPSIVENNTNSVINREDLSVLPVTIQ